MKLISRVSATQVKRAFFVADETRWYRKSGRSRFSREDFRRNFARAKRRAKKLNDARLDRFITKKSVRRRDAYDRMQWYLGTVTTGEVAVWRGAGGLPTAWTRGSLAATAKKVSWAMKTKSKLLKKRVRLAIPGIIANSIGAVQREKYLLPIVLPAGTIRSCRGSFKKFAGDIDDGCMRAIALAVSGKKTIKAYIGVKLKTPKKFR